MGVSGWGSCLPVEKTSVLKATGGGNPTSLKTLWRGTWDAWQELLGPPGQLLTQSSLYRNARDQLSREPAHAAVSDRSPGAQGMPRVTPPLLFTEDIPVLAEPCPAVRVL